MESDIDIKRLVRPSSFYKRIKNITDRRPACINVQTNDDDDVDGFREIEELEAVEYKEADENAKNELNSQPDKIRRHLPPGSGQYSVGCVDIMDNDSDEGSFFRLFYPIEKTDILKRNTQWPLWLPRKEYAHGYAIFLKKKKLFGKFINWLGGDVYTPALWQAPLLQTEQKFPVVVMSHGIGGNRTTYTTYCCELASHGFIVAAPEHRDGSASMTYLLKDNISRTVFETIKDHEFGKRRQHSIHRSQSFKEEWRCFEHTDPLGIQWDDFEYRNKQVKHRAMECRRLLDLLSDIDNGRSIVNSLGFHFSLKQFKGRLDMSKVAFAGHSFGGSTCVATLGLDKRFKLGIMLDAWMHPLTEDLCSEVTQPILMLNYEKFQWRKNVEQMIDWLHSNDTDRTMLTIKGACHQAISDFQFIASKAFGKLMEVRSDLSPRVAMALNTRTSLAFLSKHLGLEDIAKTDDILTGNHEMLVLGTTIDLSSQL
ncbi:Platelet-activating factor acetylhydrolase [Mactra antiquata]